MTIKPDHVLASGALPPGFPPTPAGDVNRHVFTYLDGGLYDNTPLAQVIHALEGAREDEIAKSTLACRELVSEKQ